MTDDGTRWVFDPGDSFAHVLADPPTAQPGVLVTMCRRELPAEHTPTLSVPPSLAVCPVCGPSGRVARPAAVFPTPHGSVIPRPVVGVRRATRRPAGFPERPPTVPQFGGPPH
ncbi:MAG: hypothetical protein ACRDTE_07455 [Pseudonocardiaceae bacterium]